MSNDPKDFNDLTDEEKEIIKRMRQEPKAKQEAILASENAFRNWLQKIGVEVLTKVAVEVIFRLVKEVLFH